MKISTYSSAIISIMALVAISIFCLHTAQAESANIKIRVMRDISNPKTLTCAGKTTIGTAMAAIGGDSFSKSVALIRDNNLYILSLDDSKTFLQITNITLKDGDEIVIITPGSNTIKLLKEKYTSIIHGRDAYKNLTNK